MSLHRRVPVVVDINVLIDAIVAEPDPSSWRTPPPVRGDAAAMTLGVLNQGLEFGLWLSPHILQGTMRVLVTEFDFDVEQADRVDRFLRDIARRTGAMIEPRSTVDDCADWEDNRILELAEAAGAFLIVSSDHHLLDMSPWRGIPVMSPRQFVGRVDAMRRRRGD
jgi:predicted nucleic acid-binding protein